MKNLLSGAMLALCISNSLRGENWPQWRGPSFNGSSTEKNLPTEFSKTQNVKWSVGLPGKSAATPIIWDDHVFLSSTDDQSKVLRALCLDRKSGKALWDHEVAIGYSQDEMSNFANPSPATDGKLVVFLYGNGQLATFDFAGQKLWVRDLQKDYGQFAYNWTYGAIQRPDSGKLFDQGLQT